MHTLPVVIGGHMKYSEIIDVERHFKSAFDITSDTGESWKTFISNEKFENNVNQIINCFTSPVLNKRNSIWIQGTYGTGKSIYFVMSTPVLKIICQNLIKFSYGALFQIFGGKRRLFLLY